MATHYLDTKGKIKDGEAVLKVYYEQLASARRRGDAKEVRRLEELIESQENYLAGLRRSLND